ncbi:MAG: VWA-like domain-containing protein [Oscillospiraceae bacterium]|nr:VWA-like domain-containing protein [Oscillospiraceae bacterium]
MILDIDAHRQTLSDAFPDWSGWIARVEIEDAPGAGAGANDGRSVYYDSRVMRYYTEEVQRFYFARQLLHLRFAHAARGRAKDRRTWQRASDAVVNRMLHDDGFSLPADVPLLPEAEGHTAEELYDLLVMQKEDEQEDMAESDDEMQSRPSPQRADRDKQKNAGKATQGSTREIDDPGLAAAVTGLAELLEPSLNRDFDWFPGTVIRDGMLPWQFRAYPVSYAEILLDTSASVDTDLLRAFVRGVKALMREDAVVRVGCFDTRFYGFHEIHRDEDIDRLELRGAGGTDFHTAISAFTGEAENQIIFTDGYAEMPEQRCDAIWVVYGSMPIRPNGGRVIYARPPQEKEKHEIDFLIT